MEPETGKELLEQTKGVAVEVYKDLGRPVIKPIGEILGFLPRTLKLTLSGWEKWLINGEESLRLTAEAIKEKLQTVPKEKLVEPEPYVAIPAIQQISFCQNSADLRDMYANLLVASMNADTKWDVHPAFVDIIKQLTPDEAKYLKSLPDMILDIHPIIDVTVSLGDEARGTNPIISNFTNYNIDQLEHPEQICSYIDNLVRLKLIEIPPGRHIVDKTVYKALEEDPLIQDPLSIEGESPQQLKYHYMHKYFRLTNLGVDFKKIVCH